MAKSETRSNLPPQAVGRRKEAVARVRLLSGKGETLVNGKAIVEYFAGAVFEKSYQKPFEVAGLVDKYFASIKVRGGGSASQLGAVVHGLSRALSLVDDGKYRGSLKAAGLLTRDARVKERRKFGNAQKARAKKQSPKR